MNPSTTASDRRLRRLLSVGAVVVALTAGCGAGAGAAPDADPVATSEVRLDDDVFDPEVVTVPPGTEVTWTWVGDNPHNVTADEYSSETQTSGTFSHTFTAEGSWDYVCTLHPGMTGRVVVTRPAGEEST